MYNTVLLLLDLRKHISVKFDKIYQFSLKSDNLKLLSKSYNLSLKISMAISISVYSNSPTVPYVTSSYAASNRRYSWYSITNIYTQIQTTVPLLWAAKYIIQMFIIRANSRFAPGHWQTALLCNDVSHWLSANLESALYNETCRLDVTIIITSMSLSQPLEEILHEIVWSSPGW